MHVQVYTPSPPLLLSSQDIVILLEVSWAPSLENWGGRLKSLIVWAQLSLHTRCLNLPMYWFSPPHKTLLYIMHTMYAICIMYMYIHSTIEFAAMFLENQLIYTVGYRHRLRYTHNYVECWKPLYNEHNNDNIDIGEKWGFEHEEYGICTWGHKAQQYYDVSEITYVATVRQTQKRAALGLV